MIMKKEYLDDVKEFIGNMPEEELLKRSTTREAILENYDIIERLWTVYQKDVEDYDCDADYAFEDAVNEVLGPVPNRLEKSSCTHIEDNVKGTKYLLSWNDEYLDMQIECGPASEALVKKTMKKIILERLVELGVSDTVEDAEALYAAAEAVPGPEEDISELSISSYGAVISYFSYEERYQILDYKPKGMGEK